MEKVKTIRIKLEIEERKHLHRACEVFNDIIYNCKDEPDLSDLKDLTNKAWNIIESILEETDI